MRRFEFSCLRFYVHTAAVATTAVHVYFDSCTQRTFYLDPVFLIHLLTMLLPLSVLPQACVSHSVPDNASPTQRSPPRATNKTTRRSVHIRSRRHHKPHSIFSGRRVLSLVAKLIFLVSHHSKYTVTQHVEPLLLFK